MPDFVGCTAVKQVANETMSMRRHRDKVDIFFTREFNDLVRGFTERENRVAGETFSGQLAAAFFQVGTVLFHLLAFSELKLIEMSRHPAVGNVDEEQPRAGHVG